MKPSAHIAGAWLSAASTQQIFALLTGAGHQVFAVGGCVRNALLNQPVADVDLCSDATPDRVAQLAAAAGLKCLPTGIDHGTVTVIASGTPYEITTFRRDIETDGRRALIAFSDRIEEDAARRDFTMNALYADAAGAVLDPLGEGIRDAHARRIRFVGTALARISEDYLRILRFFRFYAWYGDPAQGPDVEGLAACAELNEGIDQLSRERVGAEMRKLLAAPDPGPALAAMAASGVLARVLPGSDSRAVPLLVHFEEALAKPEPAGDALRDDTATVEATRWLRRLALLGGADPGAGLRLSRKEADSLAAIRAGIGSAWRPAALGFCEGWARAAAILLCRAALFEAAPPLDWQREVQRGVAARFPIRAADLPGVSGPALGQRLKALQTAWLASDLRLEKADLLAQPEG